jgi:hypothetical protein
MPKGADKGLEILGQDVQDVHDVQDVQDGGRRGRGGGGGGGMSFEVKVPIVIAEDGNATTISQSQTSNVSPNKNSILSSEITTYNKSDPQKTAYSAKNIYE